MSTSPRRTQGERTAATRAALIDAAIASLIERGWAGTTAVEVCARAGVTRGALVHHFPSLSALLSTALRQVNEEIAAAGPVAAASLVEVVDAMWVRIASPRFKAVLEAWLAAANDPELRDDLLVAILDFAKLVSPDQLGGKGVLSSARAKTFYLMARETMLGLALGRATNGGVPLGHERAVLGLLRTQAAVVDGSPR